MFDVGFTEILLIGIVALIVVGPERLPGMVRTALGYIRQIKSGVSHIRDEVERELSLDDIKDDFMDSKKQLSQSVGFDDLRDSVDEVKKQADDLGHFADWDYHEVSDEDIEADLNALHDVGPQLPAGDAEADTGIEQGIAQAYQPQGSRPVAPVPAASTISMPKQKRVKKTTTTRQKTGRRAANSNKKKKLR